MTLLETLLDMAEHDFGPGHPQRTLILTFADEARRLHAHAEAMATAVYRNIVCTCDNCGEVRQLSRVYLRDYHTGCTCAACEEAREYARVFDGDCPERAP